MAIQTASALVLGCHFLKAHPLPQSIGLSILSGQSEDSSLTGSLFSQCGLINVLIRCLWGENSVFMGYINEVCVHAFLYCSLYRTQTHACAGVLVFFTCWPHNLIRVWGHSVNAAPAFIPAPDLQGYLPSLLIHCDKVTLSLAAFICLSQVFFFISVYKDFLSLRKSVSWD